MITAEYSEEDNNGANKTDLNVCELHTTTEDASNSLFAWKTEFYLKLTSLKTNVKKKVEKR